jgi:hypothetical protein
MEIFEPNTQKSVGLLLFKEKESSRRKGEKGIVCGCEEVLGLGLF